MVRLFAFVLALVGFLPALVFVAQSLLPEVAAAIPAVPKLTWMPDGLPQGLVFAVLGIAVMGLADVIARRQLRNATRARWDEELRRVQLSAAAGATEWISPAEDRLQAPELLPAARERSAVTA
jgi:hypothetical protein